jgi:hypothetical protein
VQAKKAKTGEEEWLVLREVTHLPPPRGLAAGRMGRQAQNNHWETCVQIQVYRDVGLDVEAAAGFKPKEG